MSISTSFKCKLCGTSTENTGTELCDRCWELDSLIRRNPELAKKVL